MLGMSWPQGDVTPIRIPDPDRYGQFKTLGFQRGQRGQPSTSIEARLTRDLSDLLALVRKGCEFDLQLHAGVCEDPRNFNAGWEKTYILEGVVATDYTTGELGALDADQDTPTNETVPVTGLDYYEVKRLVAAELGSAEVVQRVVDVAICDSRQCGECGIASNGCQKVFAITLAATGSPGLPAEIIYSPDAGATLGQTNVDTLAANEDPNAIACVGANLVVISEDDEALHYASLVDILAGTEGWTRVATGFVALKGPLAIFSASPVHTWIVGEGGYIYFTEDPTSGVAVQSAGAVSTNDLNAIHGSDEDNLVAVGASNTVLFSNDGGVTWASVTGPAVGVALNAVWVKSELVWLVGTAGGELWYTKDGGATWTLKGFPGSGSGVIRDIQFATPSVGYMAHQTSVPVGRLLRTLDGGFSWYVLPEQAGLSVPDNDGFYAIAACSEDPNVVFAGGLGANATDGILLKLA